MVVLSGFILNEKNAETMAKRLDAKLFDDLSNMEGLADILLSYDYLKDVEERHKKSFLMSVFARLLKSFRCFNPTERKTARSSKDIGLIATKLRVGVSRTDVLDDEWNLQLLDKDPDLVAATRVDEYWINYLCREAKPENAPIARDLIKLSRGARSSYLNHLEAQRECNTDQEEAMRKK
ncbi:hypothetical protein QYM36_004630 [Artemia franciscana]|uniref:Uncharacterized protein n=1 Tax=Artemia franciscana TaxID=6661 RepID=A0AA88IFC5_ARTSF|nr:hypothetical protein QYM36_004630 [Artemia franciscana]